MRSQREFSITVSRTGFSRWKKYGGTSTFLMYILCTQTQVTSLLSVGLISQSAQLPRTDPKTDTVIPNAELIVRPVFSDDSELFIAMGQHHFDINDFFPHTESERKVYIQLITPTTLAPEELHRWKNKDDRTKGLKTLSIMRLASVLELLIQLPNSKDMDSVLEKVLMDSLDIKESPSPYAKPMSRPFGNPSKSPGDAISAAIIAGIVGAPLPKGDIDPFSDMGISPPPEKPSSDDPQLG